MNLEKLDEQFKNLLKIILFSLVLTMTRAMIEASYELQIEGFDTLLWGFMLLVIISYIFYQLMYFEHTYRAVAFLMIIFPVVIIPYCIGGLIILEIIRFVIDKEDD